MHPPGILLQNVCPLRLWIASLDTSGESTLTLSNLPVLLYEVEQKLAEAGAGAGYDLFLAAHGHVGHVVSVYTEAVPGKVRGLLLLGTYLHRDFSLKDFPVSVMTIVGELDGVTRITRIASTVQSMEKAAASDPDLIIENPLVVLRGSNHAIFAGDELPLSLYELDIEPEADEIDALQQATDFVMLFFTSILGEPEGAEERARKAFQQTFADAKRLTEPIRTVRNLTQEDMKSYWVKTAQKWLSGLEGPESSLIEVDSFVTNSDILPLPPTLGVEGRIKYVITFSDVSYEDAIDDVASVPAHQAALEIAARMIGPERIQNYLLNTTIARNYTCKDINYASFLTAYHSASEEARNRFDQVARSVIFLPDIVTDSEAVWKNTPLKVDMVGHETHVTSVSYKTRNEEGSDPYAGLYFCKLLPPERALEWIYVDSIRRNVASPGVR
ncbi:titin [Plakobranchus ocellatus]|uniref:Titin n=1 Tax=Plakobranchus ocellatus TaxID=259542 RepID=A0AAV4BAR5_9GAST|nr:titin [Plakobranchus ocellatus]